MAQVIEGVTYKFGDWDVLVKNIKDYEQIPGGAELVQRKTMDLDFKYRPRDITIPRTITFAVFHTDDEVLEVLESRTLEMKRHLIDVFPV